MRMPNEGDFKLKAMICAKLLARFHVLNSFALFGGSSLVSRGLIQGACWERYFIWMWVQWALTCISGNSCQKGTDAAIISPNTLLITNEVHKYNCNFLHSHCASRCAVWRGAWKGTGEPLVCSCGGSPLTQLTSSPHGFPMASSLHHLFIWLPDLPLLQEGS